MAMRITILLVLALVLGCCTGVGVAAWAVYNKPWQPPLAGDDQMGDGLRYLPNTYAKVEVDEPEYDFGSMDSQSKGKHKFVFRNVGTAPLRLRKGQTTCKCTLSEVGDNRIAPGESGIVTLEWSGKELVGPYSQVANIHTNDPERSVVELRIVGEMTAKARAVPSELVMAEVAAGRPASADVLIYGYQSKPLDVKDKWLDVPEHFDLELTPLTDDEVKKEKYATCGYRLTVNLKPGLPLGPFRRTITLSTNVEGLKEIGVSVKGTVASEVTISGPGWNSEYSYLAIGSLRSGQGATKPLFLTLDGIAPDEATVEVAKLDPEFLEVRLGEKRGTASGRVTVIPITIEIPKDSPGCNYFGPKRDDLGHIQLKTNHATAKELDIYVRFLVGG